MFFTLKGQTITRLNITDTDCRIYTKDELFHIFHAQDCCEVCSLEKTIGNIESILNQPVTLAEADSITETTEAGTETTTKFIIEAGGHRLEIWYSVGSNGYYNEDMDCEITKLCALKAAPNPWLGQTIRSKSHTQYIIREQIPNGVIATEYGVLDGPILRIGWHSLAAYEILTPTGWQSCAPMLNLL